MLDCTVVSLFITRERVETVEPERRKAMPWPLKKQKKKKKKKKWPSKTKQDEGHTLGSMSWRKVTAQVMPLVA